jgi:uncharacterized membrane protein YtjA (UPF0391 family)
MGIQMPAAPDRPHRPLGGARTASKGHGRLAATAPGRTPNPRRRHMLGWAITFLIVALVAALFGFGVIASTAASIAKILFFVFLVLFLIALVLGRRRPIA